MARVERRSVGRERPWLVRLCALAALCAAAGHGCDAGGGASAGAAGVGPAPASETAVAERPVVLFLGDSLSAGYGLPEEQAFPALVQERIDAAGLDYRVVNAGVSGDTSACGRRRIAWLLRQPVAVLVLELGGNDMLRGQDLGALAENLRAIALATRSAYPDSGLVIAGMRAPPNLGADYAARFEEVYRSLARETGAALIPFLLEGVAADPALNQPDGIHPTAEGHRIVAETVWRTLEPLLRSRPRPSIGAEGRDATAREEASHG
jgi:acyl-CoA thioesterase-1